jgi:hypothetical protein
MTLILSDYKRQSSDLADELQRAATLGTTPPTPDELREHLEACETVEPDECDDCSHADDAAREFSQSISARNPSVDLAWESLINLLSETKAYSHGLNTKARDNAARDAQRDLEAFVKLAMVRYQQDS